MLMNGRWKFGAQCLLASLFLCGSAELAAAQFEPRQGDGRPAPVASQPGGTSTQQVPPGEILIRLAQQLPMENILCNYSVENAEASASYDASATNITADGNVVSYNCNCTATLEKCIYHPEPEEVDDQLASTGRLCPGFFSVPNEDGSLRPACDQMVSRAVPRITHDLSAVNPNGELRKLWAPDAGWAHSDCSAYCKTVADLSFAAEAKQFCGFTVPPAILVRGGVCEIPQITIPVDSGGLTPQDREATERVQQQLR